MSLQLFTDGAVIATNDAFYSEVFKMKRFTAIILALCIMLATLCSCEKGKGDESGKISVVATIFPQYDFARQIGGQYADVTMLAYPGNEVHDFDATLSDMAKVENCDLFIYISEQSEQWVGNIFSAMGPNSIKKLSLLEAVNTVEEELVSGMEHEHEEEHEHTDGAEIDQHVWTSVRNCMVFANRICDAFCDPKHSQYYKDNAAVLLEDLVELDVAFEETVLQGSRKTIVFAERFPFRYLAKDYALEYYAAFSGCSSNTEPSLSTISFLTDKVKNEKIPVVFYTEFSTQTVADTICNATGAKKLLFHSCHNVTAQDFENGVTYVELMRQNVENLREALN